MRKQKTTSKYLRLCGFRLREMAELLGISEAAICERMKTSELREDVLRQVHAALNVRRRKGG